MSKRVAALVVIAALLAGALQFFGAPDDGDPYTPPPPTPPLRESRLVEGRVLLDGAPAEGAKVTLYEDADEGFEETVEADAEGAFALKWTPTAALRSKSLYLVAKAGERWAVRRARPGWAHTIELPESRSVEGMVVDPAGRPIAAAQVGLAVRNGPAHLVTRTGPNGEFTFEGVPAGAPLALVAFTPDSAPMVDLRYRCGQRVTLRLRPGLPVSLSVRDPDGQPIVGATARVAIDERALRTVLPAATSGAEGRLEVAAASLGGDSLLRLEANGSMTVLATASPHEATEVVMWPRRSVMVTVYDAASREGVDGARLAFDVPHGAKWWGDSPGMVHREFEVRPGARRGEFRVELPACRVGIGIAAAGYSDAPSVRVDPDRESLARGLAPLPRPPHGSLILRAEGAPEGFPVAVAVGDEEVSGLVEIHNGTARFDVPVGKELKVASPGAFEGFWLPLREIEPFKEGEAREEAIPPRPAVELQVAIEPAVEGEAVLIDVAHKDLVRPARATLKAGRARFWVRPLRKVQVDVTTSANYFEHSGEFVPEETGMRWEVRLRPAAGVSAKIEDVSGNPVAFARGYIWEPDKAGRIRLDKQPREFVADHAGLLRLVGLRGGEAILDVRLDGLRGHRISPVRLVEGKELDLGTITLEPPTSWSGRVVDRAGRPVSAVWVRVLEPMVRRLQLAGGAGIDLYDLQAHSTGPAISGSDGRFRIDETAIRAPLLALYPSRVDGFAAMAVETDGGGGDVLLRRSAYVELEVPSSVEGVYRLVSRTKAVLIKNDPPVSLRPLPLIVPAGGVSLIIRLRDGRWAAPELDLKPGETLRFKPTWTR